MQNTEKKNRHMTIDDRNEIQDCLGRGMSFKEIARQIGKDPTTVSKEVKLRSKSYSNGYTRTDDTCPRLLRAPFVCNGCEHRNHANCIYPRRKYSYREAQKEYETTLVESREGIPLNKEQFYETERIISESVKAGQNVYHAIHANNLSVSKTTVYRHIEKGYYTISKLDLPRAVKFKPRRKHAPDYVPKGIRSSRSYQDFLTFQNCNPDRNCVEMDTVIGRQGGKVIMTFQFVNVDFMFGLLLDNKTASEAGRRIIDLKKRLMQCGFTFGDIFPTLLTDNGGEFSNVYAFENNADGEKETSVFFCDPNASYQKPHVENNHTLFRGIVPGGRSFDTFTQKTVDLIFSHVNAVKRYQFNGKSAYDLFSFTYSTAIADALGISKIEPRAVIQTPLLLKEYFPE